MNAYHGKPLTDVTEERLDRLVDGELSQDEYRSLLESFDREPDGWRRCALAFLEAQAWQRELPAVPAEGFAGAASASATSQPHAVNSSSFSIWSTWSGRLALAASWFLVFALGAGTYQAIFSDAVRDSRIGGPLSSPTASRGASSSPNHSLASQGASQGGVRPPADDIVNATDASGLEFQIADPQGNVLDRYQMPVANVGMNGDSYSAAQEPEVPDELADAARALKYDVRTNRTWIPVQVQNGGNLLVPLDHIELQPRRARMPY